MEVDPRAPCIIGVGQRTVRPADGDAPEPLELWEQVARIAADDAGATLGGAALLTGLDSVQVVYCQSWQYDDPVARLASRVGAQPTHSHYSGIGGTTPQQLVNTAATSIGNGELDLALVTGAEALATRRRLKKQGDKPGWSHPEAKRSPFPFEAPFHPAEIAHEVFQAWLTFPVFDIARRARLGTSPEDYRRQLGELMAPFSKVAAANPHAWFPVVRSAEELPSPTVDNRIVGYPYTKRMVAMMDVDMAAAVLVASHEKAEDLGVPIERRVYVRGHGYATDPVYVAEHPDLSRSPAIRAASAAALSGAGIDLDDVAHLDLYSCFASSVNIALDELGLARDDSRGFTVTGGLPFFGGPGSNYLTHSIATMVDVLRDDAGSFGLISGVGMHLTKHVFGVYSTAPGAQSQTAPTPRSTGVGDETGETDVRAIRDRAEGPARVASYTVAHGRDGEPEWGLAICDLPDGERCYARMSEPDVLHHVEAVEWVGTEIELRTEGDVNLVVS